MTLTSPFPNTTEYNYVYDEGTSPCSEGNGFRRFKSLFLPIVYCLIFVFCLVGNALLICVLLTWKKVTTMTDVCLLNLAISDLLFVVSLPFQAHYASEEWIFGSAVCKMMAGIYYIGFYRSIFFITLMSIDRYIAIVHVVYGMRVRTATCGIIISLLLWMMADLAAIPNMAFNQEVEIEQSLKCPPRYPPVNILGLLIPLNILIYYSLQNLHIINDCKMSQRLMLALQLTESISFIHCCLNPVIYAFAGEMFKAHLKKILQICIRRISSSNSANNSHSFATQVLDYSDSDRVL
uniref:G-protein coupled receptors family 1 profile domain-containing protein n=1 Tax=Gopherus agassizii TaxID=38772 RepID=A0A452GWN9_9SAUR